MSSLGDVLDRHKGLGPGFDTLRLLLSISILCFHSILTSYGLETDIIVWASPLSLPASALLPMFFALSGFLVMGSALRTNDLGRFISFRVLRIVPALATEITLSALLLGTLFTTLPLWAYLTDPDFLAYFGSLIGRVRVILPGVFETNPYPNVVNVSLWTIMPELLCYAILSALILTGVFRQKLLMTAGVALVVFAYIGHDLLRDIDVAPTRPKAHVLVLAFLAGNLVYLWKDKIAYSWAAFAACLCFGLLFARTPSLCYAAIFCSAYCIVFLGLTRLPKIPVLSKGDYSYGIYLYAFPIQQTVSHLLPDYREWYWNIAFALPLTILVAAASWTFVEKPALDLRRRFSFADRGQTRPTYLFTFLLLFALVAYALFLLWSAGFLYRTQATPARMVLSLVAAGVLSALVASAAKRFRSLGHTYSRERGA